MNYVITNITGVLRVGFLGFISFCGFRWDPEFIFTGRESCLWWTLSGPVARVERLVSSRTVCWAFWVIETDWDWCCAGVAVVWGKTAPDWSTFAWDSGRFEKDAPTTCIRLMKLICWSWNRRKSGNCKGLGTEVFPINYPDQKYLPKYLPKKIFLHCSHLHNRTVFCAVALAEHLLKRLLLINKYIF